MKKTEIKIRATFIEPVLGTLSGNPELTGEFIISKTKDADKQTEEKEMMEGMEALEKATTYFPRDEKGRRFLWDYQIKGFIKEAIGILVEVGDCELSKWGFKRAVDNGVFVSPRRVMLSSKDDPFMTERPLRADTMQGERIALARSESMREGTSFEVTLTILESSNAKSKTKCLNRELLIAALDYGKMKGIGQWRNSGAGRFEYEIIA